MTLFALQGAVELGLIYALVALGLFVSYRVLDIPDLTVDGSFTLGAAVSAVFTDAAHPYLGILFAVAGGLVRRHGERLFADQAENPADPRGHPRDDRALFHQPAGDGRAFDGLPASGGHRLLPVSGLPLGKLLVALCVTLLVCLFLVLFFRTSTGLCIRATGDNETMVRSSSINTDRMKFLGLGLANALVGLSGG